VYPIILKIGFACHEGEEHIVLDSLLQKLPYGDGDCLIGE
jgi:hypothetical protein